jgi:hypothetical protein
VDAQSEHSTSAPWERAGERIAPRLDGYCAVALVAADPAAAAEVALGLGRAQAGHRRVAIADVVGDVAPLRVLAPDDAAHGLVDYIFYGVSLAKVAHPIDAARNLFVLQSGAPPIDYDALLSDARWARLASSFREASGLLLLVVPQHIAVERLAPLLDGVVLVGDATAPRELRVLARVEGGEPAATALHADTSGITGAPSVADRAPAAPPRRVQPRARRAPIWAAVGLAALVLITVAAWVLWQRQPGAHSTTAAGTVARTGAERAPRGAEAPAAEADGEPAGEDASAAPASAVSPFVIANPADSVAAVGYSVAFVETGSPSAATARIEQESGRGLPALTYAPVPGAASSGRLFIITGASHDPAGADSLLRALRRRGVLRPTQGHPEHLPLALLIQRGAGRDEASFLVNGYRLKGLPVYALEQPDGTLNLYAGAFDDPEAARALMTTFRAIGEQPRVVYRTGRTP